MDDKKIEKKSTYKRKFIASSETFSNFQTEISLYNISTIDDIIIIFKNQLKELFSSNNLTNLVKKVDESNFHIHSYTIEQILISNTEDNFYICDHC